MAENITPQDIREFIAYLRQCSDRQVYGVFEKEKEAGRMIYAELARTEAYRRGLTMPF